MQHLRLSLIATVCGLALAACSSNSHPSRYPEPVKKEIKEVESATTNKVKELEKKLEDSEKRLTEKENALTELKQKADELNEKLVKAQKDTNDALSEKENTLKDKSELEKQKAVLSGELDQVKKDISQLEKDKAALSGELEQVKKDKEALTKELEQAKPIIEAVEKEKADKIRVEKNQQEIAKGFKDNGLDENGISYVSGAMFDVKDDQLTFKPVEEHSKNLNVLVVDGKTIELFSTEKMLARQENYENETHNLDDIKSEGLTGKVGSLPKRKIGDDFAQMRFGYVSDQAGKTTLFVQGHETPLDESAKSPFSYYRAGQEGETEMLRPLPKASRWEYQGYAFYGKDNAYKQFDVNAIADMDNKKVKINMTEGDATKLTFGGAIEGNHFAGNYQGIEAKGAFYGTKGQDIGGVFYQTQGVEKDYNGVFGATQRDCGWSGCDAPEQTLKDFNLAQ